MPNRKLVCAASLLLGLCYTTRGTETVTCTNLGPVEPGASTTLALTVRVEPQAWPGVTNLTAVANASDRNLSNTIGDPAVVSPGR